MTSKSNFERHFRTVLLKSCLDRQYLKTQPKVNTTAKGSNETDTNTNDTHKNRNENQQKQRQIKHIQHRRWNQTTRRTQKQKTQMSSCTFDRKAATKLDRAVFRAVMQAWAMLVHGLAALEQAWAALLSALAVSRWSRAGLSMAMAALRQTRMSLWRTPAAPRRARAAISSAPAAPRSARAAISSVPAAARRARAAISSQKNDFERQYGVFEPTKPRKEPNPLWRRTRI